MLGHLEATINVDPLFGPFKTILGMPLLGHVGLCWRLSGLKFRKHGSVGIEFGVGFRLMLGHLEAMLGLC